MEKIKLGVSSCLLGELVRYDADCKEERYITHTLATYFELVPICPEVGSGMPVPREAMRLEGDPDAPRLVARESRIDRTKELLAFCREEIKKLERAGLAGIILKKNSPSCGMSRVKVFGEGGKIRGGSGIFARAVARHFPLLPMVDEEGLQDPEIRENFIERLFTFNRWQQLLKRGRKANNLVRFHAAHKLLLMAHSPKHYRMLGGLVAEAGKVPLDGLLKNYGQGLMEAISLQRTTKKDLNVLQHIMGYFKKLLSTSEKEELLLLIRCYQERKVPLIVPLTLLNHYAARYDQAYLLQQLFLSPDPAELMLRNRV